jgi:crotonobetainyl-CoA:carnitine CoA-transferase CaiB-like acyl-CoA transferase
MTNSEAYQCLKMEQEVKTNGHTITTTRCPIRINGKRLLSYKPAPQLGEHNEQLYNEIINELN